MGLFTSETKAEQEAATMLNIILTLLARDASLRDRLRDIIAPSAAQPQTLTLQADTPSDITATLGGPPVPDEAAGESSPAAEPSAMNPASLEPPTDAEERDAYVTRIVRPAGWDVGTWALAVLDTTDWSGPQTWSPDNINKLKKWAAELTEVSSSEGGAEDRAATAA